MTPHTFTPDPAQPTICSVCGWHMTHPNHQARQWPEGRLGPDDDGEVAVAIGVRQGRVIMQFPYEVNWVGLPPDQADEFAAVLRRRAEQARAGEEGAARTPILLTDAQWTIVGSLLTFAAEQAPMLTDDEQAALQAFWRERLA
jgi:hypothetical protein